jgi:hypothetical protein
MLVGKVARMHAGASWVLHERHERSHLIDRKAKLTAAANEGQPPDIGFAVHALAA